MLAEVLRNRGYTVTHVLEADRNGKSDREQLAYAVKHKMAIITHNVKDYIVPIQIIRKVGKESLRHYCFRSDPF